MTRNSKESGSGVAKGSVQNSTAAPSGYYWDRLKGAGKDQKKLGELLDELDTHGYARGGQIHTAVTEAYRAAGGKTGRNREG